MRRGGGLGRERQYLSDLKDVLRMLLLAWAACLRVIAQFPWYYVDFPVYLSMAWRLVFIGCSCEMKNERNWYLEIECQRDRLEEELD